MAPRSDIPFCVAGGSHAGDAGSGAGWTRSFGSWCWRSRCAPGGASSPGCWWSRCPDCGCGRRPTPAGIARRGTRYPSACAGRRVWFSEPAQFTSRSRQRSSAGSSGSARPMRSASRRSASVWCRFRRMIRTRPPILIRPSVSVGETFTDNVHNVHSPRDAAAYTNLAPGLSISADTPRLQAVLTGNLNTYFYIPTSRI